MNGKIGQHLRENEWLMGIKQRAVFPVAPANSICRHIITGWIRMPNSGVIIYNAWLAPMLPISDALSIILRLLRESGKAQHFTAHQGNFQQMQGGRVAQMLRVSLDSKLPCIPEVSANKYVLNIRFVAPSYTAKNAQYRAGRVI